ncbi:sensor histidine kinase [Gelatiniphilus marinus]|uniref:Sensor histidine kinase n=1 Tax=Gelatiniphilus marinus TaxID=1759464 RepID=A0ABW5JSR0_9FLAO
MTKSLKILLHLIIWILIIVICNASNWVWQGFKVEEGTMLIPSIYGSFFNAIIVYFNALYLYPKKRKSIGLYGVLAIITILIISFSESFIDYYYSQSIGLLDFHFEEIRKDLSNEDLNFNLEIGLPFLTIMNFAFNNVLVHVLFWILSFAYILPIQNSKNRFFREQLEREKLQAEVNFLKAQINPHSLFNGINSIYHLIDKDKEKAKDVLVRFSELLRYQVYECSSERISLTRELLFLENYFNLEKIRKEDNVIIEFNYNLHEAEGLEIAPILFIPFIENAFKYVSNFQHKKDNYIKCDINVVDSILKFTIANSIDNLPEEYINLKNSGIGLKNTKERLKLIYPEHHKLEIKKEKNVFSIQLTIDLNE